ncbi:C4-dicarboxylate ABC transporter [Tardiphaga sp. vice352]|uniref:TRAP transporter substrate-binding protein n=1 Tax=unclassified Tardiphaga TaxID=2631404 RepID=UPI001165593C|nr:MULTISPECIES: TRAP transporter substrate-binding protein [unclassified Tardiphaga]QDM18544.1 C4-dicarboxylate ABC transporter [Tardiphaga sp. vice278]QDM23544.1 C4-dicarboxylate ABC transporter [Tardiphaga sp. vice154]QDM28767.1 C4-dicarboxylate ABC transporter [Tardiphaga sp. vice304]QDM33868.1 C4-dicarboxylate ABC transporter [Tardiphaga sp. vice352]
MRKAIFAGLAAACVVSAMPPAINPAAAQDKTVTMKVSLWVPPAHPLVPATQAWAADIEKASGGSIKMSVFPSEQLGKAFDHYDMARDGIADITYVNPGYQPGRFPIISAGQIPFVFADGKKGTLALNEWYRKYAQTEMKDTKLCFAFIHDPGSLHGKKKIVVPGDLNGVKVRPAQSTIGEMVKLFGGTNVQASAPESRDAIERGVADEIAFPWGSIFLFGIDKVVKYHIDTPLYTTVFTYNINLAKYNAMSAGQKKIIDDHCTPEWASKVTDPWVDFEANGREKMKALEGHEVYKLTPEQLAEWKKGVEPLRTSWAAAVKKAGGDAEAIDAELKAALKKFDAGL